MAVMVDSSLSFIVIGEGSLIRDEEASIVAHVVSPSPSRRCSSQRCKCSGSGYGVSGIWYSK